MLTPLAIVTALLGGAWGLVADRIAARWPAHDDGSVRSIDWRTPVVVVVGAFALGGAALRFTDPVPTAVFGAYLVALVLLLGTDLDQRLLPDVVTLPAIPLAFLYSLSGANPLLPPGVLPVALVVAIVVPLGLYALSIPFGAGAIGQGDLKLLVSVGLMVGPLQAGLRGHLRGARGRRGAGGAARRPADHAQDVRALRAIPDPGRHLGGPGHPVARGHPVGRLRPLGTLRVNVGSGRLGSALRGGASLVECEPPAPSRTARRTGPRRR